MKNRGELGSQTAQEPLLLTRKLNRRLSVQNNQLTSNWEKVRESLDKIQGFAKSKMERDQSDMLKYQEKLKGNSSGSFQSAETTAVSTVTTPRTRSMSFSVEHEETMKQIWLDKAEKSRQRRFSFSNESSAQIATISSEKKRVFRRRASLSLLDLQKMNEGINGKLRVSEASKTFLNPLEEEPSSCSSRRSSVFDTNDEDEPIRVPPPSVRFPPIHKLQPAKLASRSFEKDLDFERKTSGELNDIDDLKYCRYLRVQSRRKSIA